MKNHLILIAVLLAITSTCLNAQTNCENPPCATAAEGNGPDPCQAKLYCSNSDAVDNGVIACTNSADTDGCGIDASMEAIPTATEDAIFSSTLSTSCYTSGWNVQWIKFYLPVGINQVELQGVGQNDAWALFNQPTNDDSNCGLEELDYTGYCSDANQWKTMTFPDLDTSIENLFYIAFFYEETTNGSINFKTKECELVCSPPTITCPSDLDLDCDETTDPTNSGTASFEKGCGTVSLNYTDVVTNGSCAENYTITRTWTATDSNGDEASCAQTITVSDTTPPTISCPNGGIVQCLSDVPDCETSLASSNDNCDDTVEITCTSVTVMTGRCSGTVTQTYLATDNCGNMASCNRIFIYEDDTPPSITCPDGGAVQCFSDVPDCDATIASAEDNCDMDVEISCTASSLQGNECSGTVTQTYTATDDCGNVASCDRVFTYEDDIAPSITCPDGGTVQCLSDVPDCDATLASAEDNCDNDVEINCTASSLQGNECSGTVTQTYTATDECGNMASCDRVFTYEDDIAPSISCPTLSDVECIDDLPSCDTLLPSATDNCDDELEITCDRVIAFGILCGGVATYTFTATDNCGNVGSCEVSINFQDTTPPMITCPNPITISCISDFPNCEDVTATDNCDDNLEIVCSTPTLAGPGCGETVSISYTAIDDCGNEASCDWMITINDEEAPVLNCPGDLEVSCDTPLPLCSASDATATDNCDLDVEINCSMEVSSSADCYTEYTYTYNGTDDCGNMGTCSRKIKVTDDSAPQITCLLADITIECVEDLPSCSEADVEVNDDCSAVSVTCKTVLTPGDNCSGIYTITYTATDACGNASSCKRKVTIEDTSPPVMRGCPIDITVQCIEDVPVCSDAGIRAIDNCGDEVEISCEQALIEGNNCWGIYLTTYIAIDKCGNKSTCTRKIEIDDFTAPTISHCAPDITVECFEDIPTCDPNDIIATDNCDDNVDVTCGSAQLIEGDNCWGIYAVTYTAEDNCGNITTCIRKITIDDFTPPTITQCAPDITVECYEDIPTCDPNDIMASDKCDDHVDITCGAPQLIEGDNCWGIYEITYTATDDCGNLSTCKRKVTIDDFTGPQISGCPSNKRIACYDDLPACDVTGITATDRCDDHVEVSCEMELIEGNQCWGIVRYTYTAEDDCGNTAICTREVEVDDWKAPTIHCPENTPVSCVNEIPCFHDVAISATDNCTPSDEIEILLVSTTGGTACVNGSFEKTYNFSATDNCGNVSYCSVSYYGSCQDYCTFTQGYWGTSGGGTTQILNTLFQKYGPIVIGCPFGNSLTISSPECVIQLLPGGGTPTPLANGNFNVNKNNNCDVGTNRITRNGRLKNNLANNVIALHLNILYNLHYNNLNITYYNLENGCINIPPRTLRTLEKCGYEQNISGLIAFANDILCGIFAYLGDKEVERISSDLTRAITDINEYWDECNVTDPCDVIHFDDDSEEQLRASEKNPEEDKLANTLELKLSPNPTNSILNLEFSESLNKDAQLLMVNSSGQIILSTLLVDASGLNKTSIDVSLMAPGIYYLKVQSGKDQIIKKVIKIQ